MPRSNIMTDNNIKGCNDALIDIINSVLCKFYMNAIDNSRNSRHCAVS